jgi:hypothetical protein
VQTAGETPNRRFHFANFNVFWEISTCEESTWFNEASRYPQRSKGMPYVRDENRTRHGGSSVLGTTSLLSI